MSKDLQDDPIVFIYVKGSVVQDVDCPDGVSYRVVDYDNDPLPQFRADRVSGGVLLASEYFYDLASCCAFLEGYGGIVNMQDDDGNWKPIGNASRGLLVGGFDKECPEPAPPPAPNPEARFDPMDAGEALEAEDY